MKQLKYTSYAVMALVLLSTLSVVRQPSVAQTQQEDSISVSASFQSLPPNQQWTDELHRVRFELEHNIPDQKAINRPSIFIVAPPDSALPPEHASLISDLEREKYLLSTKE